MRRERAISDLIASLARDDRGAVTRMAACAGVERSTASHWIARGGARTYSVPADALAAVCDALGTIEPLQAIADELGYDVVPKGRPTTCARPVQESVWDLLARIADLGREIAAAARDGKIDPEEAMRIRAELRNARDIIDEMLSRLPREAS